jgi:hypothetical protein
MASETLSEAERMRRVPGIVFVDGATGRRAHVEDSGLDVFEVIKAYRECGRDRRRLAMVLHWLTDEQLAAALTYTQEFPDEIEARLAREDALEQEGLKAQERAGGSRH